MAYHQVDIAEKEPSRRTATAQGRIRLSQKTIELIREKKVEKGDPLSLASVTGIMASKKTPELLALCHSLKIESTTIETSIDASGVVVTATVSAFEKTGVEMEALTAVAVALLNIWDAVKPYEKDRGGQYPTTEIDEMRVLRKAK